MTKRKEFIEEKMPDFEFEKEAGGVVAGVDEAGRGPWAGPVVAGAVVIADRNLPEELLTGLDDSKKLSAAKREKLYSALLAAEKAGKLSIGIGEATAREIDEMNILQATFLAMRRAVAKLKVCPEKALIDGNRVPKDFPCPCRTIVKGDARSMSIAAASIAAKVIAIVLWRIWHENIPATGLKKMQATGRCCIRPVWPKREYVRNTGVRIGRYRNIYNQNIDKFLIFL